MPVIAKPDRRRRNAAFAPTLRDGGVRFFTADIDIRRRTVGNHHAAVTRETGGRLGARLGAPVDGGRSAGWTAEARSPFSSPDRGNPSRLPRPAA